MQTPDGKRRPVLFGFTRRHALPRLRDTLFHRNVTISLTFAGILTFVAFRIGWFPALQEAEAKDLVAGILAFSALGFGAATAATVLALSMPRSRLYLTMIVNGKDAPRARVISNKSGEDIEAVKEPLWEPWRYNTGFRSYYGDLIFVFLWTMAAQLIMGAASLVYFAIAGDARIVDIEHCRRAGLGFFLVSSTITYAIMQLGSLIKALADYAARQEQYDRALLITKYQQSDSAPGDRKDVD